MVDSALKPWPTLCGETKFLFFFVFDNFKTFLEDRLLLYLREREKEKESEKEKKKGGGGLKPTLLVGRTITT
jgi:hypothetical protein